MSVVDEPMVELYAVRDERGVPLLGDCTLLTGDGSTRIVFTGGRAQAPRSVALAIAASRADVEAVTVHGTDYPGAPPPEAFVPVGEEPRAERDVAVAAAEVGATLNDSEEVRAEKIRAAQEYLRSEGEEDIPEPEVSEGDGETDDTPLDELDEDERNARIDSLGLDDTAAAALKAHYSGEAAEEPATEPETEQAPPAEGTGDPETSDPEPAPEKVNWFTKSGDEVEAKVNELGLAVTGTGEDGKVTHRDRVDALRAHDEEQAEGK